MMTGENMTGSRNEKRECRSRDGQDRTAYRLRSEQDNFGITIPEDYDLAIRELRMQYNDIRVAAEKNVDEQSRLFRIFDHAGIAAVIIDDTTTIVRANRQFEVLTSLRRRHIEGKMDWAWFLAPGQEEVLSRIDHQLRRRPTSAACQTYEVRVTTREKVIRRVRVIISRVPGTRWNLAFILEPADNGAGIHGAPSLQKNLMRHDPVAMAGVLISDSDARVIHLNENAMRITGWSSDEARGRPAQEILNLLSEEEVETGQKPLTDPSENGVQSGGEHFGVILKKSGILVPIRYSVVQLRSEDRESRGYAVEFSELFQKEPATGDRVSEDTRDCSRPSRDPHDTWYCLDRNGQVIAIEGNFGKPGFLEDDVRGWHVSRIIHPDDRDRAIQLLERARTQGGQDTPQRFRIITPSHELHWVENTSLPSHERWGKDAWYAGVLHDVTDEMLREQALLETIKKLSLLNSLTRHDMRNQVLALQSYVYCALDEKPGSGVIDHLMNILSVSERISDHIGFMKNYDAMGSCAPRWCRIRDIMPQTSGACVQVQNSCNGFEIFADPMITQVFFNLADNAVRHGGDGGEDIHVGCGFSGDSLVISVEDNGAGIAGGDKELIFERGVGKNTGMGLFLIREVLSITGLTIRETGTPGKGARFEITVPQGSFRVAGPQPDQNRSG
ncbi:MAG: PAS domain S-box protein [Methanomicrobiales archaeon]|nr:PAS domain S-box protein [Methanomicrobiales archaeon]